MSSGYIVALIIIILICIHEYTYSKNKYVFNSSKIGPTIGFIGGVHGNEISGAITLQSMVDSGYFAKITNGRVKVIPVANPSGFKLNSRYTSTFTDLNRIYKTPITDKTALEITQFFSDCDIVIDFHEGWSWNRINSNSLGSTITPSFPMPLANDIVTALNNSPTMKAVISKDPRKQFDVGKDSIVCEIPSTMECYMRKNGRPHILVEIPGQNSGHPLNIRLNNIHVVVDLVLKKYGCIL